MRFCTSKADAFVVFLSSVAAALSLCFSLSLLLPNTNPALQRQPGINLHPGRRRQRFLAYAGQAKRSEKLKWHRIQISVTTKSQKKGKGRIIFHMLIGVTGMQTKLLLKRDLEAPSLHLPKMFTFLFFFCQFLGHNGQRHYQVPYVFCCPLLLLRRSWSP